MSLERKIKRNQIREEYGNKNMKTSGKAIKFLNILYGEYAKMHGKTIKEILAE